MNADELLTSLCLNEAWKRQTLTLPNPAVGAMVTGKNGEILSLSAHEQSGDAHAEVNVLKEAWEKLSSQKCPQKSPEDVHGFLKTNHAGMFKDCSIYVTLEPCNHYGKTPPCAELLETIKPKRIIIGTSDETEAGGGKRRLRSSGIEISSGVLEDECKTLLYPFERLKNKGSFNLFKIAQRINGDYVSGSISSTPAKVFTHDQRRVADKIIISGKTLREDDPILDCRHASCGNAGKIPAVRVLSRQEKFPDSLRILRDPHRDVKTCREIPELGLERGFNVIEGGWELFENLEPFIDMLLLHVSPTMRKEAHPKGFKWEGELCRAQQMGNDGLLWIKKP